MKRKKGFEKVSVLRKSANPLLIVLSLGLVACSSGCTQFYLPSTNNQDSALNIPVKVQTSDKIRFNEIKYESQFLGLETAQDEYIELLVIEGGFDPSYWYVTDWDTENFWEIPVSCPVVSANEFIVIHLGIGTDENVGPVYHFYMNDFSEQLANQGQQLILYTDNDTIHNWEEDIAHDFIAYGNPLESELSVGSAWCGWPNDQNVVTDSIKLAAVNYESLQLVGNDLDNSSNWYSAKPTPGGANKLSHCYIQNFEGINSKIYINETATNISGLENGRILLGIREPEPPIYRDTGFAYGVYVCGDFAYVASGSAGLGIINVSDPLNPEIVAYQEITGGAREIFVQDDYAYVASGRAGLGIINVSDPLNPEIVVYQEITGGAREIFVQDDYAYVASGSAGLGIINVSDPISPGAPIYRDITGFAQSVHVHGNYAYVADEYDGFAIINVSDPTNPGVPIYRKIGSTHSVHIRDDYIYIGSSTSLVILDISNPTNPGRVSHQETTGSVYDVHVSGDYAYVANDENGLAIIDISDPTNPATPVYQNLTGAARDVFVSGDFVYVAARDSGLAIVETAKRASISIVQSVSCYTSTGFVQNVTLNANQTIFPNTTITYHISYNGKIWIPISLNETYSFVTNPYNELYWRAVLTTYDTLLTPQIDFIKMNFDIYYDKNPPIVHLINPQNNTIIAPGTPITLYVQDFTLNESIYYWFGDISFFELTEPWTIIAPTSEGYHRLIVQVKDSAGHLTAKHYRFYVTQLSSVTCLPQTHPVTSSSQPDTLLPLPLILQISSFIAVLCFIGTMVIVIKRHQLG